MTPELLLRLANLHEEVAATYRLAAGAEPVKLGEEWLTPRQYAAASAAWREGGAYEVHSITKLAAAGGFAGAAGESAAVVIRRRGRHVFIRADARPLGYRPRRIAAPKQEAS